jgi:hypothetical protein
MNVTLSKFKYFFINNWRLGSLIFLFFCSYYALVFFLRIDTDIQPHAFVAFKFAQNPGPLTPNFLFFFIVALLSGFSKVKILYGVAAIAVIAASITAKYFLNIVYFRKLAQGNLLTPRQLGFLSAGALFVFCLPGINFFKHKQFLLGQLAVNVWHNSTIIFLLPFAIILFFQLFFFLQNYQPQKIKWLALLIIVNALIKPSLLFTVMPAAAICSLIFQSHKTQRMVMWVYALSALALMLVMLQFYIIYLTENIGGACQNCNDGVGISPFEVWRYYSSSVLVSFISSTLFPLLYVAVSKGKILTDKLVQYAVLNWAFGLLIYILFIESGGRKYHGNFGWQMILGNYFLFLVFSFKLFTSNKKIGGSTTVYKILKFVYIAHVFWGVCYFVKIILFKHYA